MNLFHWPEVHYDALLELPEGQLLIHDPGRKSKRAKVDGDALEVDRVALRNQDLQPDGPKAKIAPAEVPNKRGGRHRPLPDRTFKSAGLSLVADRDFWLQRAFDDQG